jgi:uncharacterized membrane protein
MAKRQAPKAADGVTVQHRYLPLYGAEVVGVVVAIGSALFLKGSAMDLGAIAFFLTYIATVLYRLPRLTKAYLRAHADQSDVPGYVLLALALLVLAISAVSLFGLLNSGTEHAFFDLALGIAAVMLGWLGIHTMLAFHYAFEYYGTDEASAPGKDGRKPHIGGLDFPGTEQPDALSFLYFSFVVAMTAQVSDVTVTSNAMRRLVLQHGLLSFFFNTVILAMAVNIVVTVGH